MTNNLPTKRFASSLRPRSIFEPWFSEFFNDEEESIFTSMNKLMRWDERMGSMDFEKTEKEYSVLVDVPGLTKEDVHVDIEEGCMKISAERKPREKKEGTEYLASERSYRRFERIFRLPEDADLEKTEAVVENGVLKITIGRKVAEKSTKTVKIK